jgi:hypothetical protein
MPRFKRTLSLWKTEVWDKSVEKSPRKLDEFIILGQNGDCVKILIQEIIPGFISVIRDNYFSLKIYDRFILEL